ncbi:MAG: ADP-forming succinate--CoA ligase subunit beta [Mangrovibacterium sp.]
MKIHEHQAVDLFERYGIAVPKRVLCHDLSEVKQGLQQVETPLVVKAQVLVGGRGKAGGVKLAKNEFSVLTAAQEMLGMNIKGCKVEKVLLAEAVSIAKEFYVGFVNDRNSKSVTLMVSAEGGVEIEEVARTNPEAILKLPINPLVGLQAFQARNLMLKIMPNIKQAQQAASVLVKLYQLFMDTDATLAEINPLVTLNSGNVMAIDGKMNFDDNALFRQAEILALREPDEQELLEIDAKEKGLAYVKLDGNIGCMVNGAGLAMATMDMIKRYGGEPANFLDIGGSSNPEKVVEAMSILLNDKNVEAILINIFGGITRCDDVAKGLVIALKQLQTTVPIAVRLSGTNAEAGLALLQEIGLPTMASMGKAAQYLMERVNKKNL